MAAKLTAGTYLFLIESGLRRMRTGHILVQGLTVVVHSVLFFPNVRIVLRILKRQEIGLILSPNTIFESMQNRERDMKRGEDLLII